jgi:hypothetical protein
VLPTATPLATRATSGPSLQLTPRDCIMHVWAPACYCWLLASSTVDATAIIVY